MKRKLNLGILIICLFLFVLTSIKSYFFSDWTFISPEIYNSFYSLHFCSFIGLIGSTIVLWKRNWFIAELTVTTLICAIVTYGQFNPIDTTTFPRDKRVLNQGENSKLVMVEYKNCKTNRVYQDTLLVDDKWVFRRIKD